MPSGQSETMLTFSTASENTQPHYSFWFGAPLTKTASEELGIFTLSVSAPKTVSVSYPVSSSYGIPKKAWVNKVTISKLSSSGDSLISRAKLNVTLPNSKVTMVPLSVFSSPQEFDAMPSLVGTSDARGTYKVNLASVSWRGVSTSGTYNYMGQISVEYLYAFGA